jgi:glutamine amidotransferase
MCELMGLCFYKPMRANFSFHPFAMRARDNADGWGLAWYPDRALALVKEPLSWQESAYARFVEEYDAVASAIYIAHVRKKTSGRLTYADTHPFHRECHGREYCFAHNGTIRDADVLPAGRYRPLGDTDSERVFCHLLGSIERHGALDSEADWRWLHGTLREVNERGSLNCLLSDGVRLFCYRDRGGWKDLQMRRVGVSTERAHHLGDETLDVDLNGGAPNRGLVVATRRLDDRFWIPMELGELMVVESGRLCFSTHGADRIRRKAARGPRTDVSAGTSA